MKRFNQPEIPITGINALVQRIDQFIDLGQYTRAGVRLAPLVQNGYPNPISQDKLHLILSSLHQDQELHDNSSNELSPLWKMLVLQSFRSSAVLEQYLLTSQEKLTVGDYIRQLRPIKPDVNTGLLENIRYTVLPQSEQIVDTHTRPLVEQDMRRNIIADPSRVSSELLANSAFWALERRIFVLSV